MVLIEDRSANMKSHIKKISVVVNQKAGNRPTLRSSYTILGLIPIRVYILQQRYLLIRIHYFFTHNS